MLAMKYRFALFLGESNSLMEFFYVVDGMLSTTINSKHIFINENEHFNIFYFMGKVNIIKGDNNMKNKKYLLDANIIIKIWNECPNVITSIENAEGTDFKISKHIAGELSTKEFKEFNGVPVLTNKFLKLLNHILEESGCSIKENLSSNVDIRYDYKKNIYYINENKLSKNDYELICLCSSKKYTLVTDDKKVQCSARIILGDFSVLSFDEFIKELKSFNILI